MLWIQNDVLMWTQCRVSARDVDYFHVIPQYYFGDVWYRKLTLLYCLSSPFALHDFIRVDSESMCIAMWPCQLGPLHCIYSVPLMASSSRTMLCIVTMSSISSGLTSTWTISSCWITEKNPKHVEQFTKVYALRNPIWAGLQWITNNCCSLSGGIIYNIVEEVTNWNRLRTF